MVSGGQDALQEAFLRYAEKVGVDALPKLGFFAGNLWFLPVSGKRNQIDRLSQFTLVRVIRPMPILRSMRPMPMITTMGRPTAWQSVRLSFSVRSDLTGRRDAPIRLSITCAS